MKPTQKELTQSLPLFRPAAFPSVSHRFAQAPFGVFVDDRTRDYFFLVTTRSESRSSFTPTLEASMSWRRIIRGNFREKCTVLESNLQPSD
jgi:hypothetical protein